VNRPEEGAIRDHWRMLLVMLVISAVASLCSVAQEIPFELTADTVFISADQTYIEAEGSVAAQLEDMELSGDKLVLEQAEDNSWQFHASGSVQVSLEGELELAGESLAATIGLEPSGITIDALQAEQFHGQSTFENSDGELHTIYFEGKTGDVSFDETGKVSLITVEDVEVSTCDCCGVPLRSQPYALRANRLLLYPDQSLHVSGASPHSGFLSTCNHLRIHWRVRCSRLLDEARCAVGT